MQITFAGAAGEVTGSRHLLTVNGKRILLDCGMFQGRRKLSRERNEKFLFDPKTVDAVLLSHAHIDHSGNIPNLVKQGFTGKVYATEATADLCYFMLRDSAFIQEKEAEYLNRHLRKNGTEFTPIYTMDDADASLKLFVPQKYDAPFTVCKGVEAVFYDAGHILGSSVIVLTITEENRAPYKLAFTGDLGRRNLPILRDPYQISEADFLITESTYGNRFHESITDAQERLAKIVNHAARRGGKILIPAFAVERTQEIVYMLHLLHHAKKIPELPIYVDSPLSINVTEVFKKHKDCFDEETWQQFLNHKENPFGFKQVRYVHDVEESKNLNNYHGPCIIISASGMCEFGRILHHLKNNIEDSRTVILLVGFMAKETLGRKLLEKQPVVNIFGKPHRVKAEVEVIDAFSAHADRSDLLNYITRIKGLKKIFLVHGEEDAQKAFKEALNGNGKREIFIPTLGETITI